jgi:UDP-3-O-acyl-N-acetylglucosamine deacetylase
MDILVITSQYYHSRFSFVVEYNEDTFQQQAAECVKDLETYKRQLDDTREFNLGEEDEEMEVRAADGEVNTVDLSEKDKKVDLSQYKQRINKLKVGK